MDYKQIIKTSEYKNDRNCCTVIACSVVMDLEFSMVHKEFMENGRVKNEGMYDMDWLPITEKIAKKNGYKCTMFSYRKNYKAYISEDNELLCMSGKQLTIDNYNDFLPRGNYIFGYRGHVLGARDSIIEDWNVKNNRTITNRRFNRIVKFEKS